MIRGKNDELFQVFCGELPHSLLTPILYPPLREM